MKYANFAWHKEKPVTAWEQATGPGLEMLHKRYKIKPKVLNSLLVIHLNLLEEFHKRIAYIVSVGIYVLAGK